MGSKRERKRIQKELEARVEVMNAMLDTFRSTAYAVEAYAPYSDFFVHASVLTTWGDVYGGANFETVSFNQTMHAEHSAVTAALVDRDVAVDPWKCIAAVFVSTPNGAMPCGHCRQMLAEYAVDMNIPIIVENGERDVTFYSLDQLLPYAFGGLS